MSGWERGRAEILGMIERQELETVIADAKLAERRKSPPACWPFVPDGNDCSVALLS